MKRIRLIHWNRDEGRDRAEALRGRGFEVEFEPFDGKTLRRLGEDPPDAVVIDLCRMPSQGRDVGVALRIRRSTRHIPLVFAGGAPEKVARVREVLPDAVYVSWDEAAAKLKRAASARPESPIVPSSQFAAYAGRPLPAKLGISKGVKVGLIAAPRGFVDTIGPLPEGASVSSRPRGRSDLLILFVRSMEDLEKRLERAKGLMAEGGSLWIAWQKRASGAGSDLTQASVRRLGLDSGLVDYRICSIDGVWSALRFARRDK